MKKLFTSMGLAAMSLFAAAPMFAQQQQLTAAQAETIVKAVYPAVFQQIKTVSGLDINALAEGNQDWALYTNRPDIQFLPDSARIKAATIMAKLAEDDEEGIGISIPEAMIPMLGLDNLKVTFSDYKEMTINVSGVPTKVNFPGTVAVDLAEKMVGPGGIKILIDAEPTTVVTATPFKKLVIKSEVNPMLETAVQGIPSIPDMFKAMMTSGTIFSLNQEWANNINTVTTELNETGLLIANMIGKAMDDDDEEEGEEVETGAFPKNQIVTDMTTMATDKYYTVTKTGYLPNGTALVDYVKKVYNVQQSMPMIADSIVTVNYDLDGRTVVDITKTVFALSSTSGAAGNTITKVQTDSIFFNGDRADVEIEKDSTIMVGNLVPLEYNNITASIIKGVLADMATATPNGTDSFVKLTWKLDEEGEYYNANALALTMETKPAATAAEKDTLFSAITFMSAVEHTSTTEDGTITEHYFSDPEATAAIGIDMVKDQAIISVYDMDKEGDEYVETLVATLYAKSNLLSIATDNEEIAAPQSDVTFGFTANGIYVNNCKQGRYTIVDMNGRIVANGVIAGEGAYIATPQLTRGKIYVIAVQDEKGLVKAAKFAK